MIDFLYPTILLKNVISSYNWNVHGVNQFMFSLCLSKLNYSKDREISFSIFSSSIGSIHLYVATCSAVQSRYGYTHLMAKLGHSLFGHLVHPAGLGAFSGSLPGFIIKPSCKHGHLQMRQPAVKLHGGQRWMVSHPLFIGAILSDATLSW